MHAHAGQKPSIPLGIRRCLLPEPGINVLQLHRFGKKRDLSFSTPPNITVLPLPPTDLSPKDTVKQVRCLQVPSRENLQRLKAAILAKGSGVESLAVVCHGKEHIRMPLWVIRYWESMDALADDIHWWKKAISHLQDDSDNDALAVLSTIPWDGTLPLGLSWRVWDLAGLATTEWLSGTQLDMLGQYFNSQLPGDKIFLRTTDGQMLIQRYRSGKSSKRFRTQTFLSNIGNDLKSGRLNQLGLCVNVNSGGGANLPDAGFAGNHWVALVVDVPTRMLLFGDSQGFGPPVELIRVVRSWLKEHFDEHFGQGYLEYTRQPTTWCCGDLAINMVAHRFDGEIPLASSNPGRVEEYRRGMLEKVVSWVRELVSQVFHLALRSSD